jgi:transposase
MDKYIGLDVHSASCTLAVVGPKGKRLGSQVTETRGPALIEALRSIPGQRHLCVEEGTQSEWLYEILSPHVEDLVVAHLSERRGQKDDRRDAFALAQALRVGSIPRRVYKGLGRYRKLRQLARAHRMVATDVARVRNRLKSLYRSRGVSTSGKRVYGAAERAQWLAKLDPATRAAAEVLYPQLDALVEVGARAQKDLVDESHRHPITRILETVPGLGKIRVAELVPIVITPHRFRTSRQFWSYCGLGIVMRSSSDWVRVDGRWIRDDVAKTRGLNRNHNRTLKWVFKGAATTVLTHGFPLRDHYDQMLEAGTKPNLAKLTLARKIAAITLAMWKNEEVYDPKRHRGQQEG